MKKALLLIGIPLLVTYICGIIGFEDLFFFTQLDWSDPAHQYTIGTVALLALIQSALIKLMLWQRDQRLKR